MKNTEDTLSIISENVSKAFDVMDASKAVDYELCVGDMVKFGLSVPPKIAWSQTKGNFNDKDSREMYNELTLMKELEVYQRSKEAKNGTRFIMYYLKSTGYRGFGEISELRLREMLSAGGG